jgi:hypothetical protein
MLMPAAMTPQATLDRVFMYAFLPFGIGRAGEEVGQAGASG